jgi:dTDP-4-dehydrorhamnose reductase
MRILVLGASGLLGHTVFRTLAETTSWAVLGTVRDRNVRATLPQALTERLVVCQDLEVDGELSRLFDETRPDVVINCLSMAKPEIHENNLSAVLARLSTLPQRISLHCGRAGARMIHFSSDGVFSGKRGGYSEADVPDATDVYGVAKLLGEVRDAHAISIRTSMIGHELGTTNGLLEWFLAQGSEATCFRRAIFSGLPTTELALILRDHVIPVPALSGVYHVAAKPISKYDLLRLVAEVYDRPVYLIADDGLVIDRSLSAERFALSTGYRAPAWPELIRSMRADHMKHTALALR